MDNTYRRTLNRQLTVQESRHRLARKICHGGNGQSGRPTGKGKKINWCRIKQRSPCCE
jgi:hypothetical protein